MLIWLTAKSAAPQTPCATAGHGARLRVNPSTPVTSGTPCKLRPAKEDARASEPKRPARPKAARGTGPPATTARPRSRVARWMRGSNGTDGVLSGRPRQVSPATEDAIASETTKPPARRLGARGAERLATCPRKYAREQHARPRRQAHRAASRRAACGFGILTAP